MPPEVSSHEKSDGDYYDIPLTVQMQDLPLSAVSVKSLGLFICVAY